jgi:hypothetical protein
MHSKHDVLVVARQRSMANTARTSSFMINNPIILIFDSLSMFSQYDSNKKTAFEIPQSLWNFSERGLQIAVKKQ